MVNVFVFELIKSFQAQEEKEFELFLKSPYFNNGASSEHLIALAEFLIGAKNEGQLETLIKETIYEKLLPNQSIVENKIDKLMSELKRLLQNFIIVQRHFQPERALQNKLDLAVDLRLRGLNTLYHKSLDKIKKEADAQPWVTIEGLFFKHLVALEEHEWHSIFNKAKGDINILDTLHNLEHYYWALKTEMLNRLFIQQKITKIEFDSKEVFDPSWTIPQRLLGDSPLLRIIWEIHQILITSKPEINSFYHLLEALKSHEHELSPEDLIVYYTYLRNICTILIDEGNQELYAVLHRILLDNLKRGCFYFDGKIMPNSCLNITQTALNFGEIAWTKDFLESHKGLIFGENETSDFYFMNLAMCLFAEKRYAESLEIIPFGSSYSIYHLLARRFELKIYYELDDDLLPYKIDAFKMFISRAGNKVLSKHLHEHSVNFINFLRQLSLSPKARDKNRAARMIERINKKKLVADRAWLLEKARELGEGKK